MIKCEKCGSTKNVEYSENPYEEEVNGKEIWEYLCDDCYITAIYKAKEEIKKQKK